MNSAPRDPLSLLSQRLEQLLELTRRLDDENRQLRAQQEQWLQERSALISKNDQARSRVEAMIQRLKAPEHNA